MLHAEGPSGSVADRTIEQCSATSATSRNWAPAGRGIGPRETACLDLVTGEEFVGARPIAARELPAALPRRPAVRRGRPTDRTANNDSPNRRTVGPEQLRRLARSVDSAPAQASLFG
ncbi:MAG: hypothetical protein LC749_16675 [Actinobacteria bacterium]|nr:hypothetical protein [Actinomycetota bacterium]